ncbi:glutaredoxin 3 [Marchantia polymorpha subsp. ruderalis]|uniref:Glutaredoxin domain-containing protein n=2 Tax=Marchantia polymorpha TaxID=3197 RepID=A0AAF6BDG6_MARPO|nr:hypothetical protein MARPO_0078s0046 [Marchantia polymorpha]BBN10050.1 hypothetical protein Mp_5g00470 [Marchantia polymorpha subsp. ruderalis]|eukprot:PTQ34643.1 hypothetical protein MARPO_0078s0046 [Marchantia polymorpha]
MALVSAQNLVSQNAVVVFSKSYCPYCKKVKQLLSSLGAQVKVVELDLEKDGDEIQSALTNWTKQRTVPNVFVGGQHIGGCDDTMSKHNGGKLLPLLKEAGAV